MAGTTPEDGPALGEAVEQFRTQLLGGDPTFTGDELAAGAGVPRELTRRLWRAMGFADVPDDERAFTPEDRMALERTASLMAHDDLGEGDVLHLARVLGLATARMADSMVSFSAERMASGHRSIDATVLAQMDRLVVYLLNRNLAAALHRHFGDVLATGEGARTLAVGFADLVGYTRLSQRLDDTDLAALIEDFEAKASDIIVVHGGRVVKTIGDEVMYSSDPADSLEIGLLLAEAFDEPDLRGVRVGMASGEVITRAGDLFGPTVNLAARTTGMARPGSVLVAEDLFVTVESDPRYRLRRLKPRRLKGIGWANLGALTRVRDPAPIPAADR